MQRLVILISGRGSNMQALLEAGLPAEVSAVISNEPLARGLDIARRFGVRTQVIDHREFADRSAFDLALGDAVAGHDPHLVVLAGFMRVLTGGFVSRFAGRLINIHPSLLPAFPGIDTHRRALEEGVRVHGCTVHFLTPALDRGPIVVQSAVAVLPDDTEEALAARVLRQEHLVLPQAVRWFLEGRLEVQGSRVRVAGSCAYPDPITSPLPT
ncbi:MAG TPA: phosphoribosylglycinamide formyltransferase [Burkholderiales bacterium]|nr:phosphoribosylglycinamide formyltransferase [Burkholderiales bacterium]